MIIRVAAVVAALLSSAAGAQTAAQTRQAERDLFEKVVEIPTVKGRGQMPKLTALLSAELRKAGITDITIKNYDDTQDLIARWHAPKPSGKKPILLMAHMDVVEAKASDWKFDPFTFREQDGYYLGRGSNDNKAGLTALVLTMQELHAAGFQPTRDIILLFTGDEETAQNGAKLASTQWKPLIDAEYALNSDAGGGGRYKDGRWEAFWFQLAEKTYADYRFVATNRGGHSSAPRTDNAIYQLAGALKALEEYRFKQMINDATRESFKRTAEQDKGALGEVAAKFVEHPDDDENADDLEYMAPGQTRTRCVATQLSGGHAPNALPQRAEANVNCRIFPGVDPKAIQAELQTIAGQFVKVELASGGDRSDPSPFRQDVFDAYRDSVKETIGDAPINVFMSSGATDGTFTRAAGIPTYGVGGQWGYLNTPEGVHGLDERVLIEGFHAQMPFWKALLRRLAG
jgi:acetylornithine deacetylase/succinyl-diaminopimelate desuccinylase-like protein